MKQYDEIGRKIFRMYWMGKLTHCWVDCGRDLVARKPDNLERRRTPEKSFVVAAVGREGVLTIGKTLIHRDDRDSFFSACEILPGCFGIFKQYCISLGNFSFVFSHEIYSEEDNSADDTPMCVYPNGVSVISPRKMSYIEYEEAMNPEIKERKKRIVKQKRKRKKERIKEIEEEEIRRLMSELIN